MPAAVWASTPNESAWGPTPGASRGTVGSHLDTVATAFCGTQNGNTTRTLFRTFYLTALFGSHLAQQKITVLLCPLVVGIGVECLNQPTVCLYRIAGHAASDSVHRRQSIGCPSTSLRCC